MLLVSLLLSGLWAPMSGADDGGGGARESEGSSLSLVSWTLEGKLESGNGVLLDRREIYNQGEGKAAVSNLFSLPGHQTLNSLEVGTDATSFSLLQTEEAPTTEVVRASQAEVRYRYIEIEDTNAYLNQLVDRYSDPTLLALGGNRLLVMDFAMEPQSFATITMNYTISINKENSLNHARLPLGPSITIEHASGLMEGADEPGEVRLDVSSSYSLEGLYSPTHEVTVLRHGLRSVQVTWSGSVHAGEALILYYNELSTAFGAGLLNYRLPGRTMFQENEDGYFMFLFTPNTEEFAQQALPKDIVFVIDTSGSMSGNKIVQAKQALKEILDTLSPADRFTIVRFSTDVTFYSRELKMADADEVHSAQSYVNSLRDSGSTNINEALLQALDILDDDTGSMRPREVVFLTDGQATAGTTDSDSILANIMDKNQLEEVGASMFVFGIGSSVNTYLLDRLASDSQGTAHYITKNEDIDTVLTSFYDTIVAPVLTNVSMEVAGVEVLSQFPDNIPNLYRGGELNVVGAYAFHESAVQDNQTEGIEKDIPDEITIYINGTSTEGAVNYIHTFDLEEPGKHAYLPRIYATRAVGELLQQNKQQGETPERVELITEYGMRYGIETPYTSLTLEPDPIFDSDGFRTLTGKSSVEASQLIHSYSRSRIAGAGLAGNARLVGDRTLVDLEGVYVQSTLLPKTKVIELEDLALEEWLNTQIDIDRFVRFASPEYFALAEDPVLRKILALGTEVVFANGDKVIGITRGNLVLFVKDLQAERWGGNLSVTWNTSEPATSVLFYRSTDPNATGEWTMVQELSLTRQHNITLNLTMGIYEFYISSTDAEGNTATKDGGGEYFSFYNVPVFITEVKTMVGWAALDGRPVTIRWYTNVPAIGTLHVRSESGWSLTEQTEMGKMHEVTFTVGDGGRYYSEQMVWFYVTAEVDGFLITEDNNGQNFWFKVVKRSVTSPSYHASMGLLMLSALVVATVSAMLGRRRMEG